MPTLLSAIDEEQLFSTQQFAICQADTFSDY